MLAIQPFVASYTRSIALATGIDIEVADTDLVRVAGTGVYAEGVGKRIERAREIYRRALDARELAYVETPRADAPPPGLPAQGSDRETLRICMPVVLEDKAVGVIGMTCFTMHERVRVMMQKRVYIDVVRQMAEAFAREVRASLCRVRTNNLLDALLRHVDGNRKGVVVLDAQGGVTYCNEAARREMRLGCAGQALDVRVRKTGTASPGKDVFNIHAGSGSAMVVGRLAPLDMDDPAYASILIFDPLSAQGKDLQPAIPPESAGTGLSSILGRSRPMRSLAHKVKQIAKTSSTVLITGESGTGKELFARAIHAESDRADKPFITVNCGAIPDTLLENELFGHVRGAFTGANPSGRAGKFELARDGIIFLDEIGAMPLHVQASLLRVLQERSIIRLGSNRQVSVEARVIAATNEDLQDLIRRNMFREDLYYRLNVIPLEIPPLRRRREDIPVLARHFWDKYCMLFKKTPGSLGDTVMDLFMAYRWPGNVREIENTMEYLANITPGGSPVAPSALPQKIRYAGGERPPHQPLPPPSSSPGRSAQAPVSVVPLASLEREAIRNAITLYGDDTKGKSAAAKALGIGVATLYRKMKNPAP